MHLRIGNVTRRQNQLSSPPAASSLELNLTGIRARDGVSITAPVFIITKNAGDLENYNYIYCVTWGRYYFITDLVFDGELQYAYCQEDVLATWNSVIRSQSFYCLRSTVGYDDTINDTQFPMITGAVNVDADTENPFVSTLSDGCYVTGIISSDVSRKVGSVSYLWSTSVAELIDGLMDTCYDETTDDIQAKAYADPMQYVVSCTWFPFYLVPARASVNPQSRVGLWKLPAAAGSWIAIDTNSEIIGSSVCKKEVDLSAPTPPSGANRYYKHFPPYTTLTLYAPPFGEMDLPEECYRWCLPTSSGGYGGLRATIYVDMRTGGAMMAISPLGHTPQEYCAFVMSGQLGVDVNITGVTQSGAWRYNAERAEGRMKTFATGVSTVTGAVSNVSGSVGKFVTGRIGQGVAQAADTVGDFVSGAVDTISSGIDTAMNNYENLVPSVSSSGGTGDLSGFMLEQPWSIRLVFVNNKIDNTNMGEPHMSDCTPASVSGGFAIFSNVNVTGEMLQTEKSMINQYLTSGVYVS